MKSREKASFSVAIRTCGKNGGYLNCKAPGMSRGGKNLPAFGRPKHVLVASWPAVSFYLCRTRYILSSHSINLRPVSLRSSADARQMLLSARSSPRFWRREFFPPLDIKKVSHLFSLLLKIKWRHNFCSAWGPAWSAPEASAGNKRGRRSFASFREAPVRRPPGRKEGDPSAWIAQRKCRFGQRRKTAL